MIDKVLILACDRPEYLEKCLKAAEGIAPVFVLLDKPANKERLAGHHDCKKILRSTKVEFETNKSSLGCTSSMFKLLDTVMPGEIVLILEDDIILNEDSKEGIEELLKSDELRRDFIIKLSSFYWGWITNFDTIQKIESFRLQDVDELCGDEKEQTIRIFQQEKIPFLWDKFYEEAAKYCNVQIVESSTALAHNIGQDSSLQANDKQQGHAAIFIDGEFKEVVKL